MMRAKLLIEWICSVVAAFIMLQTLWYKFSAAAESVYIFTQIGMEPVGRIGVGIVELIASVLLLLPAYRAFGALIGVGLMLGALFFHITFLGIVVLDDGGKLFWMALGVLFVSVVVLILRYKDILHRFRRFH